MENKEEINDYIKEKEVDYSSHNKILLNEEMKNIITANKKVKWEEHKKKAPDRFFRKIVFIFLLTIGIGSYLLFGAENEDTYWLIVGLILFIALIIFLLKNCK